MFRTLQKKYKLFHEVRFKKFIDGLCLPVLFMIINDEMMAVLVAFPSGIVKYFLTFLFPDSFQIEVLRNTIRELSVSP